jgi:uncharacterized protein YrzB (UPF0473 family)
MEYLLLSDFDEAEEIDDGIYLLKIRVTEDTEAKEDKHVPFSEGDVFHIRKKAPAEANAIALTDDWMYFNTFKSMLFEYVFKD